MPSIPSDRPGSELVELQVSSGDDLPSAIDDALGNGVQVYVPAGEYTGRHSDLGFSADDATIYGDPAGVSIDCEMDSNATMDTAGTLRIENIDILGKKPEEQVKIDVDLSGGRLEWVNFNFPDGTANPTDSYVARCDSGTGEQLVENCYFGPHGNSAFYYSERNTEEMPVTFRGCAFHNCAGPIRAGGVTVEDCIYLADGTVPNFKEEGSSSEDRGTPRMFKFEGGGTTVIENCDALVTENAGPADGPCLDWGGDATDSNSIEVSNSRFGNFGGREVFDTASAPGGAVDDSSLSNVSVVSDQLFSGDEISGDVSNGDEPRTDIESRRWNPLEGESSGDSDGGSGGRTFGLPSSFDVVTGSEATAPATSYTVWTPVENPEPPEPVSGGGSDSGGFSDGPSQLRIAASPDNPDANCDVTVTADGEMTFGDESEPGTDTITENDDGSFTATSVGMDPGAIDTYAVAGSVTAVTVTSGYDVTATLDGESLSVESTPEGGDQSPTELAIRASADNPDTDCDVTFTADGAIEFGDESEPETDTITENDDGSYTATSVSMNPDAVDSYLVSGTITEFVVTDGYEVSVTLDGESVSLGELVGDGEDESSDGSGGFTPVEDASPKTLIIDSSGTLGEAVEYDVTVTGTLERDEERTMEPDDGLTADLTTDSVDDNRAVGSVGDGQDAFRYTGQIQSLSLSGVGVVRVQDE
ncbi:hypothetical protein NDI56_18190 [Haloarcula sp. S1CR25-12]|uniref:Right-handed parallel beta-helix repeat-containing protein n=1 Tax=Haloarcula saliterrae TaxID=2950534 RepID=A0ABU2FGG5_9EURY|nr:hypothetical protein [Haloarcula sp. S1CR25-12]MDS0261334.1 hypothetical protein [Haloarcula sp. S1CR25-12]